VKQQILTLLEQHGSLAADQIAAHLHEQPDAVQNALRGLHEHSLIDVLSVGQLHLMKAAAYWRLTEEGRAELARWRQT
jgi:DNA-binding PadR family transcriptional regulator